MSEQPKEIDSDRGQMVAPVFTGFLVMVLGVAPGYFGLLLSGPALVLGSVSVVLSAWVGMMCVRGSRGVARRYCEAFAGISIGFLIGYLCLGVVIRLRDVWA